MRLLLVGDPHVTVEELDDCQALMDLVCASTQTEKPDAVVILGDLHHNHSVVRVEVTDFWITNLERLASIVPAYLILGNHDKPNDSSSKAHALQPYKKLRGVTVADFVMEIAPGVVLAPYFHDKDEFLSVIKKTKTKTLFCHQTFDGSCYENGFYASDGVDPALLDVPNIVSGHIHTEQTLDFGSGTVWYVGSPRWRTQSDAGVKKSLVIYDTDTNTGYSISTSGACSPIGKKTIRSKADLDSVPFGSNSNARLFLEIEGTKDALPGLQDEARRYYPKARIRLVCSDVVRTAPVAESDGILTALDKWIGSFKPKFNTPPEVLKRMLEKRL